MKKLFKMEHMIGDNFRAIANSMNHKLFTITIPPEALPRTDSKGTIYDQKKRDLTPGGRWW
jgi:hypothetical protein